MKIALVDDDSQQLQALQELLTQALDGMGIALAAMDLYSSAEALFAAYAPGSYDLLVLDIYMTGESGVELARRIRETDESVLLAFCTSSNEFAAESYEVGAGYYLQKPVSAEKLRSMLRRLNLARIERNRTLRLPDGSPVLLRQILYTEYHNHTVTFHLKDMPPKSVYMNHADAEAMLLHYKTFRQINKGCIVNFGGVVRADGGSFCMANGEMLPISRRRAKEVLDAYTAYHFEKMDREVDE